jgi:N-acetylglucosamine-6-sulfatase
VSVASARPVLAAALAVAALALTVAAAPEADPVGPLPVNVLLVVTDDQAASTWGMEPAAMPWLEEQLADPASGWVAYPNAVVSTPMCCPSRATILTGLTAGHTGVVDNHTGWRLDESATIATRLHDAGYRTGLVGKYLNEYPWDRGPYVPPGWDRWFAKANEALASTYYDYPVVDQGHWRRFARGPGDYVTDVLGREALAFVRTAPTDRPWFLAFTPPAPHEPWRAAPRHEGAFDDVAAPVVVDQSVGLGPAWLRELPPFDDATVSRLGRARLDAAATLLAVDEQLQALAETIQARGGWDRTVVLFLSDNGVHFGERGWFGKRVPYEPSITVPFAVRWPPGLRGPPARALVSNLDIAPTIADAAGIASVPLDGISLLEGVPADRAVPVQWAGDAAVPAWRGVRTRDAVLIAWSTGERELYDLAADPAERRNIVDRPAAASLRGRLVDLIRRLRRPSG